MTEITEKPKMPIGSAVNPDKQIILSSGDFTFLQEVKKNMEQFVFPFNMYIRKLQKLEQDLLASGTLVNIFPEDTEDMVDKDNNPVLDEKGQKIPTLKKDFWDKKK